MLVELHRQLGEQKNDLVINRKQGVSLPIYGERNRGSAVRVKQGRNLLGFEQLLTVDSHQAHLAMLNRLTKPPSRPSSSPAMACVPAAHRQLPEGHAE